MATQKQIAERMGVSRQLVGHALQGRSNVSPETKLRIQTVAKEMGYHPEANWSARVMLANRSGVKGQRGPQGKVEPEELAAPPVYYIVREPSKGSEDGNLRFIDYFNGFVEAFSAWKRGFQLICPLDNKTDLDVVRNVVETGRSSGIVNLYLNRSATEYLIEKEFPMTVVNEDFTSHGVPSVIADHTTGYAQAWRAAVQAGHQKVAFVGYGDALDDGRGFTPRLRECEAGAKAAKVNLGIERAIPIPDSTDEGGGIWNALVAACGAPGTLGTGSDSGWPTLVFAQNDMCAKNLVLSLQAHGMRVPQDVSVIGFDDISIARHFNPPLATLSKPRFEMAKAGAQLLSDVLAGRIEDRPAVQSFPVEFIQRGSFAPMARTK